MANPISNLASPLPPQAERASRSAPVDADNGVESRQVIAGGGKTTALPDVPPYENVIAVESTQQLEQATRDISSYMQSISRSLEISIDGELGTPIIQVLDTETDEIVRQIPAEETLRLARLLAEKETGAADAQSSRGLLLDSEG
ncbi:MAG: flagellar protein FlaG [Congregibacter sp.]